MLKNYMDLAIKEANKAAKVGEVPVGAVIEKNGKVVAKAHNNRQRKHCILGHAEINCIIKAEKKLKDWRLDGCTMYVTLEPCEMCNLIIKESRIKKVEFLLSKDKNVIKQTKVCEKQSEYEAKLKEFFKKIR